MRISVIIPVYNAEKYLRRCVDSVIKSLGKTKGEVILVDNNSTDGSPTIMKSYRKEYPEIVKTLECKTWGASAARNAGAKLAQGDYIWFIDADDEITPDAISKLLKIAYKQKADLIMLGATKIYLDGHTEALPALDPADAEFKSRFIRCGLGPWQVILRRKWYFENNFEFHEGIIQEDMEMMPALVLYTDNYAAINESLYNYYETPGSVLHKTEWNPHYLDIFPALEGVRERFKRTGALERYHDTLEWFFIWNLLLDSAKDFEKSHEGRVGFRQARRMLKMYFPNWRKNPIMKRTNWKTKLKIWLNYYK